MVTRGKQGIWGRLLFIGIQAVCVLAVDARSEASVVFSFSQAGGGATGAVPITGFNENAGNALAQGSISAIHAGVGSTFQLYFQTTIGNLTSSDGNTVPISSGQYTVVGSVTEQISAINGTQVQFSVAPEQASNSSLTMYYNPTAGQVNALAGTGFNLGTAILTASPVTSAATVNNGFTTTLIPPYQPFDQVNLNHYSNTQAVFGTGSYFVSFAVNQSSLNANFFPSGGPTLLGLNVVGSSNASFLNIEPSLAFPGLGTGGKNIIPNLGAINGLTGPDFQFQTTGSLSTVPEPSSLTLMGLGFGGLLLYARRRNLLV